MKAVIETKRLLLRNFRLSDAESMFESYCHNENITRYLTWYPHVDVQATRDFITQFQLPGIEKDNALDLAITLKGEDQVIGSIGTVNDFYQDGYGEIGYVIGEKYRVMEVCVALEEDDYEEVGRKMFETHHGLSKEYEVSCPELDFLNDVAKSCGVTGSRIMGGGFGGCTINLVSNELYDNFVGTAKQAYKEKFGIEPICIDVVIGDGSRRLC